MRTVLLLVLTLVFSSLSAQSKKDIKALKIKNCTETTVLYDGGKETANYKSGFRAFDKEGNTIEDTEFNQNGSVKRKELNKYSGKNKTEEVIENHGAADEDGPKVYKKSTFKYNGDGDKTEETEYDAKGSVIRKTTFAYNKNKDKQFEMVYDGAGKLIKKTVYGYDAKGLKISKSIYGPNDVLQKMVKYSYGY